MLGFYPLSAAPLSSLGESLGVLDFVNSTSAVFQASIVLVPAVDQAPSTTQVFQASTEPAPALDLVPATSLGYDPVFSLDAAVDFLPSGSVVFQLTDEPVVEDGVSFIPSGEIVYDATCEPDIQTDFIAATATFYDPSFTLTGISAAHSGYATVAPHVAAGALLRHTPASTMTRH